MKKRRLFRLGTIREQLTFKTVGIVCIAFAVCYLFTYYYFSHILQQQALEDNISILRQHVQQIEYLNGDVRNLGETLAVSQGVQRILFNQNLAAAAGRTQQGDQLVQLHNAMGDIRRTSSSRRYFRRGILAALDDTGFYWGYVSTNYFSQKVDAPEYLHFQRQEKKSLFLGPDDEDTLLYILQVQNLSRPQRELGTILLSIHFDVYRESMRAAADSFNGYLVLSDNGIVYQSGLAPDYLDTATSASTQQGDIRIDETPEGYLLSYTEPASGWRIIAFTDKVNLVKGGRVILPFVTVALLFTILLCLLLIRPTVRGIVRPLEQLTEAMQQVSAGNAETAIPPHSDNEIGVLAETFQQMLHALNRSMREAMEYEKEQQRLQMELLLSQMNPHFIYNTLNSIVYMARRAGNDGIVSLTTAFIRILQDIIPGKDAGPFTTVGKDIDNVRAYLTIQHYRYADLFEEDIHISEQAAAWPIPRFVIQPLVENAIFHGLNPKGGNGLLTIRADPEGELVRIEIRDNGIGMQPQLVRQLLEGNSPGGERYGTRSIGISNIRNRLNGLYGQRCRFEITSIPGEGASFILHLPASI